MTPQCKIFIDRLKDGQTVTIDERINPSFLEIDEKELQFQDPIWIKGKAYLTGDHLILQLSISTEARMPCAICNELFPVPITIDHFTHAEPIESIINHIFDFTELLRESILLQIPAFVECNGGICPERALISGYLKQNRDKSKEQVYYPFNEF